MKDKKQKAEDKPPDAELLYQTIFNQSPDGILIIDTNGNFIAFNDTAHQQLGYSREEFEKLHISDIDQDESPEEVRNRAKKIIDIGSAEFEVKHSTKAGEIRDVHVIVQSLTISDRVVLHSIWRDITERKKVEEALQRSEERYRAIVENQLELVDRYLPGGILTYVNNALARYFDMRPEDMLGKSFYPFLHEEDRTGLVRRLQSVTKEQPDFTAENRAVLRDGTVRWHQWTHRAFFDKHGRVLEYQSVGRDITNQKRVEDALKQSEKRYRQLFENLQEGFMIQDIIKDDAGKPVDVRYLDINPAIERFLGKTRDEVIGKTRTQVLGIPDPAVIDANNRVAITGQPFHMVRYSSGAKRWYESISYSFGPGQVATLVLDITERKRAEEEIIESEKRYHVLFDQSPDGVLLIDTTGKIIDFNEKAHSQLGYSREEFAQLSLHDIDPVESPQDIQDRIKKVQKEGKAEFEVKHRTKTGDVRDVQVITQALMLFGRPVHHSIWRDVTERKRIERSQQESEEKFRTFFESASDALFIIDMKGQVLDVNAAGYERLGYTKEELLSLNLSQLDAPSFAALLPERMAQMKK